MKRLIYLIITGALVLSFLTGCSDASESTDAGNVTDNEEASEVMAEDDPGVTLDIVLEANRSENIFESYGAVLLKEHDYSQDRDTEDYFSKDINYRKGPDYFSYMSRDMVVSDDPEGAGYGCVEDEDEFMNAFASFMKIDWNDYSGDNVTLADNTITISTEWEDIIITFDEESLLFVRSDIKNKDGSDWLSTEYEYFESSKDEDILAEVKSFISEKSGDETVSLTIKADDSENVYQIPMGFSAIIYSDNYYHYEGTDEAYFGQPIDGDTVLVKMVIDEGEDEAEAVDDTEQESNTEEVED